MNLKICAALAYLLAGVTAGGIVYGQLPQKNDAASSVPSSQVSSAPSTSSEDTSESTSSVPGDTAGGSSLPQESQAENSSSKNSSSAVPSSAGSNSTSSSKASVSSGSNGSKNLSWQDLMNQLTNGQKNTANCPNNNNNTTTPSKPSTSIPSGNSSSSVVSGNYAAFQNRVVELVNEQRTANGLKPLTVNTTVTKTATLKSEDMAKLNYFDHTSPTYGSPFDMMKQYGISYRTAGENIAKGQTSPEQVMQGWMNSEGHRKNILNSAYTQIGVGVAKNAQGQLVWTQQFIG